MKPVIPKEINTIYSASILHAFSQREEVLTPQLLSSTTRMTKDLTTRMTKDLTTRMTEDLTTRTTEDSTKRMSIGLKNKDHHHQGLNYTDYQGLNYMKCHELKYNYCNIQCVPRHMASPGPKPGVY